MAWSSSTARSGTSAGNAPFDPPTPTGCRPPRARCSTCSRPVEDGHRDAGPPGATSAAAPSRRPGAHYLPEFGAARQQRITLPRCADPPAGIPHIPPQFADVGLLERPNEILTLLSNQKPRWVAGRRLAYHALTGGFVLGRSSSGSPASRLRDVMRTRSWRPLRVRRVQTSRPGAADPRGRDQRVHRAAGAATAVPAALRRVLSVDFVEAVRVSNDPRS